MKVNIVGAGLSGVEAAFFLANNNISVDLYEMRDTVKTPVHQTNLFAELVCSNSFKSISPENAHGLLKYEMKMMNSLTIEAAYLSRVPSGGALSVDRTLFSQYITQRIKNHPKITIYNEEVIDSKKWIENNEPVIFATGPMTSEKMAVFFQKLFSNNSLYFFDAAAPIINGDSINYEKVFFQSRYQKGTDDYLNAPFTKDEYYSFIKELKSAQKAQIHDFEKNKLFEGCMPIEELADRGDDTPSFGPMKPVGLIDPKTGKRPYAVVQLRLENINKSMYNLVGFQTRLKWSEQQRIFRMIPGLENAEFYRYGVMHKNIFLNYPSVVDINSYSIKKHPNIYFAGQITGVEGYMESAASGIFTAFSLLQKLQSRKIFFFPEDCMLGALQKYTITTNSNYQPMASNFGLLSREIMNENGKKIKGEQKRKIISESALSSLEMFIKNNQIDI